MTAVKPDTTPPDDATDVDKYSKFDGTDIVWDDGLTDFEAAGAVATHSADTTSVHGIADTSALATDTEVATAVSDHNADTTSVHGIADTSVLATDTEVASAVSAHSADTTSVHGIADTSVLATDTEVATAVTNHSNDTTSVHGIADTSVLATDAEVAAAVSAHTGDTTDAHDASAISIADSGGVYTGTDVETALQEVPDVATAVFEAKFSWGTSEPVSPATGDFWLDTT